MHDERSSLLAVVADILLAISQFKGRCCKKSNYTGLVHAVKYLNTIGYSLPYEKNVGSFARHPQAPLVGAAEACPTY
jgi:hypothetical protein